MNIYTIILTFNEEVHIERCIKYASKFSDIIYIIDSYSKDKTIEICKKFNNVKVYQNKFITHAQQFNWGLSKIKKECLIFRLDADEIIDNILVNSLIELKKEKKLCNGYFVDRYISFENELVKYGGMFPTKIVRVFKNNYGRAHQTLMDEHILVDGSCKQIQGKLIDCSVHPFSRWFIKHISYAKLEALKQIFEKKNNTNSFDLRTKNREMYKVTYYRLPLFFRAIILFLYRYFIRFGFLNRVRAQIFIFFQVLVYRIMVDYYILIIRSILSDPSIDSKLDVISKKLEISKSLINNLRQYKNDYI